MRPEATEEEPQGMCMDKGYDYAEVRQTVTEPGGCTQTLVVPSQVSVVHGFISSQSASELQPVCAVMMQSDGSEFGVEDGVEQTSVRLDGTPPKSLGWMQHVTRASLMAQLVPAHLLLV